MGAQWDDEETGDIMYFSPDSVLFGLVFVDEMNDGFERMGAFLGGFVTDA